MIRDFPYHIHAGWVTAFMKLFCQAESYNVSTFTAHADRASITNLREVALPKLFGTEIVDSEYKRWIALSKRVVCIKTNEFWA